MNSSIICRIEVQSKRLVRNYKDGAGNYHAKWDMFNPEEFCITFIQVPTEAE